MGCMKLYAKLKWLHNCICSSCSELDWEWNLNRHALLMLIHSGELPSAIYPIHCVPLDISYACFYTSCVGLWTKSERSIYQDTWETNGHFYSNRFFFLIGKNVHGTSKILFKYVCINIGENSKIKLSSLNKYIQLKSQVLVCECVRIQGKA